MSACHPLPRAGAWPLQAAGALPLAPCEQVREAPAVPFSPGLCWARAAVAKGASVEALLRKAGDRLTWRDREALRADAHA